MTMNDSERTDRIQKACEELQTAVNDAANHGMEIDIKTRELFIARIDKQTSVKEYLIYATITRVVPPARRKRL